MDWHLWLTIGVLVVVIFIEHLEEAHDEKRGARQDYEAPQSGAAS
jgi:hypothetical protein